MQNSPKVEHAGFILRTGVSQYSGVYQNWWATGPGTQTLDLGVSFVRYQTRNKKVSGGLSYRAKTFRPTVSRQPVPCSCEELQKYCTLTVSPVRCGCTLRLSTSRRVRSKATLTAKQVAKTFLKSVLTGKKRFPQLPACHGGQEAV